MLFCASRIVYSHFFFSPSVSSRGGNERGFGGSDGKSIATANPIGLLIRAGECVNRPGFVSTTLREESVDFDAADDFIAQSVTAKSYPSTVLNQCPRALKKIRACYFRTREALSAFFPRFHISHSARFKDAQNYLQKRVTSRSSQRRGTREGRFSRSDTPGICGFVRLISEQWTKLIDPTARFFTSRCQKLGCGFLESSATKPLRGLEIYEADSRRPAIFCPGSGI